MTRIEDGIILERTSSDVLKEIKEDNDDIKKITKKYNNKFNNLKNSLKRQVKSLKAKKINKQKRELFFEDWERIFTRFIQAYYNEVEPILKEAGRYISSSLLVVTIAEKWRGTIYDLLWPIAVGFDIVKIGTWQGRLTEYEHAGYDIPIDKPDKESKKPLFGITHDRLDIVKKGLSVPAYFELEDYVFPYDPKFFKKIGDTITARSLKLGFQDYEKYDREHGTEHIMRALKNAQNIVNSERFEKNAKINEHMVYTMVGFHDFWRASDTDANIYNMAAKVFFKETVSKNRIYLKEQESPAKILYQELGSELNSNFKKFASKTTDLESSFVISMFKEVIKGYDEILGILEDAYSKKKDELDPKVVETAILTLRDDILANLMNPNSRHLKRLNILLEKLDDDAGNKTIQNEILKQLMKFLQTLTYSDVSPDLHERIKLLETLFMELRPPEKFPTKRGLTDSEDKALTKLRDLMAFLRRYNKRLYNKRSLIAVLPKSNKFVYRKFYEKLHVIELNILHRRKVAAARSGHYRLGGQGKYNVGLFLDMLGYPFQYTEVMDYIKIHDFKYIVPKVFEAQIAQDADLLDGVGAHAVKRTDIVGRQYGDEYFITKSTDKETKGQPIEIKDRFYYFENAGGSPDTVSVILCLCYCWPNCINTGGAKLLVKERQIAMEKKLLSYSKNVKKLTPSQMKELKEVIDEFKKMAPAKSKEMIEKGNKIYKKEGITGLYRIRSKDLFK